MGWGGSACPGAFGCLSLLSWCAEMGSLGISGCQAGACRAVSEEILSDVTVLLWRVEKLVSSTVLFLKPAYGEN